ncbi:MAG: hypothetical protein ACREWG_01830 [Gammaproteobacteria bacterium]
MQRPSLFHGLVLAILLSLTAPLLYHAAVVVLAPLMALKLVLAAICCLYISSLLRRRSARAGRITTMVFTLLSLAALLVGGGSILMLILAATVLIWLARSLLSYSSPSMGLADAGICALGLLLGAWAFQASGSPFWALWCFLLVQSLSALLPERPGAPQARPSIPSATGPRGFADAYEAAEAAIRSLARPHH